jgi:hypothetical protein
LLLTTVLRDSSRNGYGNRAYQPAQTDVQAEIDKLATAAASDSSFYFTLSERDTDIKMLELEELEPTT